jgi:hypothetical protein
MWPAMAISWAALSNELVYWKAFFLDRSLWKFWQMIRTFSNFILWFLFIGSILFAFFRFWWWDDTWWVKSLFKNVAIAWLLINMSWWLVAALIDLSTIMVVAVWWLPLTVMGSTTTGNNHEVRDHIRFLKSHTILDLSPRNNTNQDVFDHTIVFSCGATEDRESPETFYAPCKVLNGRMADRGDIDIEWSWLQFLHLLAQSWEKFSKNDSLKVTYDNLSKDYCFYSWDLIQYVSWADVNDCEVYQDLLEAWAEQKKNDWCAFFWDLTTRATESTWPLYTIYWSILSMSQIGLTSNFWNVTEVSLELLIKAIIWLWLMIPLLLLAAILVIRAVVLWLVIAFSPLLVLAYSFKFSKEKLDWAQWGKFTIWNIIWLIFLPVFAVFALSISVIFLAMLSNITLIEVKEWTHPQAKEQASWCKNSVSTILQWVEKIQNDGSTSCYDFMGIQTICFDEWDKVFGSNIVNILSWLILNCFGIAIMWMVVMFVLKSNKFTATVTEKVDNFAREWLMSVPIIPIDAQWNRISLWWAKDFVTNTPNQIMARQRNQYQWFLNARDSHRSAAWSSEAQTVVTQIQNNPQQFFDWSTSAHQNTNLWDYNDMTWRIVEHVNSRQPTARISDVRNTSDLINNANFWNYVDSRNDWNEFTQWLMNNWVKTSYGQTRQDWSNKIRAWLIQWVDNDNIVSELNTTTWRPVRDYIVSNNKVKLLQRDASWTQLDQNNWIRVFDLPESWLVSDVQLREFVRLADTAWWIERLPAQIYTRYLETAAWNNQTVVNQLQNLPNWQWQNTTLTLWTDTISVNVTKSSWRITWLQIQ